MTAIEIKETIEKREDYYTEFKEEAVHPDDLAAEIRSYGYEVRIVTEAFDGERYFVYVEQESSQSQLSEVTGEEEGAEPTEGDALDYLLKKMRNY